jgi:hypothetical protein
VRAIRMLRVTWRELETGSRPSLGGHERGNPGHRQGMFYRVTAPALDPTTHPSESKKGNRIISGEYLGPTGNPGYRQGLF